MPKFLAYLFNYNGQQHEYESYNDDIYNHLSFRN
jgi:hypothetical protein